LRWTEGANAALAVAIAWHEENRPGQALRLVEAVDSMAERIELLPASFPAIPGSRLGLRRARIPGFPYAIAILVQPDEVIVVGVIHTAAGPAAWAGLEGDE
jgi:plasmid stabilization system protein ParE